MVYEAGRLEAAICVDTSSRGNVEHIPGGLPRPGPGGATRCPTEQTLSGIQHTVQRGRRCKQNHLDRTEPLPVRHVPALIAILAGGLALSAADLPYILIQCNGASCAPTAVDELLLLLVVMKAIAAGALLGWLMAGIYQSIPSAFGVGSFAVCLEGVASLGLLFARFLMDTPTESGIGMIPVDVIGGAAGVFLLATLLGGIPAALSALIRLKLFCERR